MRFPPAPPKNQTIGFDFLVWKLSTEHIYCVITGGDLTIDMILGFGRINNVVL